MFEALNGEAMPRTLTVPDLPRSLSEIRGFLERPRSARLPQFMAYLRAPGGPQLVGSIGLIDVAGEVELIYWIKARFCGRGFASEAVRAMLDQARAMGHRQIVAHTPLDSEADARVLLAAGFEDTYQVEERFSAQCGGFDAVHRFEVRLARCGAEARSAAMAQPHQLSA
ncbi:GNAT family N-acetyltransferase [Novosphingobium sp. 1949]|uniref:GNAT family N-acetyltransferase n=2 Tax=Novosphingobium organovorum TaxID=2930092 RepID=A0ABT0BDK1_9SPHN|nr:GNAT family N-acetyltransferase [Novosphingobium organovorum]